MTDNTKPQDLIALLRTFIGDTQIVRAAREAADLIDQQAARIAACMEDLSELNTRNHELLARIAELEARSAEPVAYWWNDLGVGGQINKSIGFDAPTCIPTSALKPLYAAPVADSAMAKDAERYRYLRNPDPQPARELDVCNDFLSVFEGKALDEAIDAAIAASAAKGDKA